MDVECIRVKVLCLLIRDDKMLVAKLNDPVKGTDFYRLLGGTLDFYETTENGVRREIREELDSEVDNLELVKVVENLFVFIYKDRPLRPRAYNAHITPEHVIELRYLVQVRLSQYFSYRGNPAVVLLCPDRAAFCFSIDAHCPELIHIEQFALVLVTSSREQASERVCQAFSSAIFVPSIVADPDLLKEYRAF